MPRFPVDTDMPGLQANVTFHRHNGKIASADFTARDGSHVKIIHEWDCVLIVHNDNYTAMVNFRQWPGEPPPPNPPRYPRFWSAYGFHVDNSRNGIGSALYVYARAVLAERGFKIAPSETVAPDGVAFWERLDPTVSWTFVEAIGASKPDLTGRQAPAP